MKKKNIFVLIIALIIIAIIYTQVSSPSYDAPSRPHDVLGTSNASVKIVEYGDLQCPACKAAHGTVKTILSEYGDRVSYEFRHFPIESIHPRAFVAAQAAECANDQELYYEFIDAVFEHQNDLSRDRLKATATSLGANTTLFDSCLDSGTKSSFVRQQQREGNTLAVTSTPSFFVNNQPVGNWQLDGFRSTLDAALGE